MPITPIGCATRRMRRPFGRVHSASTRFTGSGWAATSSTPLRHRLDTRGSEGEAIAEGGGERGGGGQIGLVGGQDLAARRRMARAAAAIAALR